MCLCVCASICFCLMSAHMHNRFIDQVINLLLARKPLQHLLVVGHWHRCLWEAITFAETHGPHYRGTLLTSGQHMGHAHEHRDSPQHQHFIAANAPITILRLEFLKSLHRRARMGFS
jgi:hypothetical protein